MRNVRARKPVYMTVRFPGRLRTAMTDRTLLMIFVLNVAIVLGVAAILLYGM